MVLLLIAGLMQAAAQEPSLDMRIESFLKGESDAREEILKLGAFAIRPLQRAHAKSPALIDPLVYELKKAAAYPRPERFDVDFKGSSKGCSGVLNQQLLTALSRDEIPFYLDQGDPSAAKSPPIKIDSATSSLGLVKEICRQSGLDFGYFHNHIVFATPDRLWPPRPPAAASELTPGVLERAKALIEKLGDEAIDVRETASQDLFTLGGGLIPLLESQLSRPEPELVARCKRLIQALRPRARGAYGSAAAELQVLGPEDQKTMEHLRKLKMDLEFREQSLTGILGYIKEFSGLDVECADGTDSRPLTFQIKGAPLLGALSLLTQSRDLDFRIEGRKIVIDSRDAIEKKIAGKK